MSDDWDERLRLAGIEHRRRLWWIGFWHRFRIGLLIVVALAAGCGIEVWMILTGRMK